LVVRLGTLNQLVILSRIRMVPSKMCTPSLPREGLCTPPSLLTLGWSETSLLGHGVPFSAKEIGNLSPYIIAVPVAPPLGMGQ
jgi:hypothetical protein